MLSYEEIQRRLEVLERENQVLRRRCGLLENESVSELQEKSVLSLEERVALFRSIFRGREDVFARRWYSKSYGKSGYQPVCNNEWTPLCNKKKFKCAECPNREFTPLEYSHIYNHLAGKDINACDVVGLYAICNDNSCYFLCSDFDDKSCEHGYREDVLSYAQVCDSWSIPSYIERSRSGNGAHIWIFFESAIPAEKARRLGTALLIEAMNRSMRMSFKSYDRFFPNQDYLPEGGFGNLVALPLQGLARKNGNSVFVDRNFKAFADQWSYLQSFKKLSEKDVDEILNKHESHLSLSKTSESKPWESPSEEGINHTNFPDSIIITKADRLYIPTKQLPGKVVSYLRRLVSFHNPEFYSRQAMRLSTFAIPRIISCADVMEDYLVIPRGSEESVMKFFTDKSCRVSIDDRTFHGSLVKVQFRGNLRPDQKTAVDAMTMHNCGVLSATTAFGKTVAAIDIIAKLKVNTLVLVHTKALQDQWVERLNEFLDIDYIEPTQEKKRSRNKFFSPIGTAKSLHGIIDVVTIQSCISDNSVKDFVQNYGLVITDECHHVSAVSFEQVLKSVKAKFVYGLTATPIRKDGLQPIIFMQCGPIRYTADAKSQISSQSFGRYLITRFTAFMNLEDDVSFMKLQHTLSGDTIRNRQIVEDIKDVIANGRTPIILSKLKTQVREIATELRKYCPNIIELVGSNSDKEKRQTMELLTSIPPTEPLAIVATGKYVGEGFDYPRLDTLFLASPISWKGLIAQYAGRLHREYPGKTDVRIYDYVDIRVPMLEAMYRKRLKGYASVGYKAYEPTPSLFDVSNENIFDGESYVQPYIASLQTARNSVVICVPKIRFNARNKILRQLIELVQQGITVVVLTIMQTSQTEYLQRQGFTIKLLEPLTLYYTVIDKRVSWYGNVNYLGANTSEQNAIKITSLDIASDLLSYTLG